MACHHASANIFDILVRLALSLLTCAGAQITRVFDEACMKNILRRNIPFFKPEQAFYTYSMELVIL